MMMTSEIRQHYALILRNAQLLDVENGTTTSADVAIQDGRIAAIAPTLPLITADREIALEGAIVTPGLLDLHCHGYWGATYWGIPLDPVTERSGVTTAIDAGSAGAYSFRGFREWIWGHNRVETLAFLNISSIGLIHKTYELAHSAYADVDLAIQTVERHRDIIVGIKARIDVNTVGGCGLEGLARARAAATALSLPLMVHIGKGPPELREILTYMRAGDILTHCHTGHSNRITTPGGTLRDEVRAAKDRGILLDTGHGMGSFSFQVADQLLQQGELPDTISTDVHAENVNGPVFDLPTTLSKYMLLGMPLHRALACCTVAAGRAIGYPSPSRITVGDIAHVAAFTIEDGSFPLTDSYGETRTAQRRLRCHLTVQRGDVRYFHPVCSSPEGDSLTPTAHAINTPHRRRGSR
ncbi:MAG: amidohydrolase/deacetylase family metallohydrolase [Chloroflexi bacterium]|nr:amidohydrolase/deacetylase family metallohydrolase [Chloroflexota bacterium]